MPYQIHHTACTQVSVWDITCILDVASKPRQRETAENRRETNHIVYWTNALWQNDIQN